MLKNKLVRNIMVLAGGAAGAQAVTILFSPFITRIYGPEVFGVMSLFIAVIAIAVPVSALAYPQAIVLPKDDDEALNIAYVSWVVSLIVGLFIGFGLLVLKNNIVSFFGIELISDYIFLVPIVVFVTAYLDILQQLYIRKKDYRSLAHNALYSSFVQNFLKVVIGVFYPTAAALIFITFVGYVAQVVMLTNKSCLFIFNRNPWKRIKLVLDVACRYKDFPLYRAPQNLINTASHSLPVVLLATLFGPASAGFYSLGRMAIGMPFTLVGKAIADVYYQHVCENENNNLFGNLVKSTGVLFLIGLLPCIVLFFVGTELFSLIFGSRWAASGDYAKWLALFFWFNFLSKPCLAAVPILGVQRQLLAFEAFSFILKILALFVGFYIYDSDYFAIAIYSIVGAICYCFVVIWIVLEARAKSK